MPGRRRELDFCGLELAHPVINGSGTFDAIAARLAFGESLLAAFPFAAYVSKTITLAPSPGQSRRRGCGRRRAGSSTRSGCPTRASTRYLAEDLPVLAGLTSAAVPGAGHAQAVPVITNVMGSTADELARLVEACDAPDEIAAIELNVSCPNVEDRARHRRRSASARGRRAQRCGVRTKKPLIVKLTPNTADVPACAAGRPGGGARTPCR